MNETRMNDSSDTGTRPFFSVIIATYNRAKLIARALDSLAAQTERDWEAVVVDDESTDDTLARLANYLRDYPQIRYLRKPHSGEALSKNEGIRASAGRFITFLDSDDEYEPDHLASRKQILAGNPSVKFLYGGVRIIGNRFVPDKSDYTRRISLDDCVIGGTFCIERNLLRSLGGFRDILVGTDADLFERASIAGINPVETRLPTYIYHHELRDSITNSLGY